MSSLAMTLYAICLLCHTSSDYLRSGYQYGRTSERCVVTVDADRCATSAEERDAYDARVDGVHAWPDIDAVTEGQDVFCNFDVDTECHV